MAISLEMYLDRGWVLPGTIHPVIGDALPDVITNSTDTTFTVTWNGTVYTFPMSDIAIFLDRPYTYLPYPSFLRVDNVPQFMQVGQSFTIKPVMFFSNGISQSVDANDEDFQFDVTNEDIISIVAGRTITALEVGECVLEFNYTGNIDLRLPVIVVATNASLFAQSHYTGQFPNGIN